MVDVGLYDRAQTRSKIDSIQATPEFIAAP
jgi:hypothetical protein